MEHAGRAAGVMVSRDADNRGAVQPAQRKPQTDSAIDLSAALYGCRMERSARPLACLRRGLPAFGRPLQTGSPHDSLAGNGRPCFYRDESAAVFAAAIREPS